MVDVLAVGVAKSATAPPLNKHYLKEEDNECTSEGNNSRNAMIGDTRFETKPDPEFTVSVGMGDVDAYAFLYYGVFFKYNERAACAAAGAGPLVLCQVPLMKFVKPVRWGIRVRISTFLCLPCAHLDAAKAEGKICLLHAWVEDSEDQCTTKAKPVALNVAIAVYSLRDSLPGSLCALAIPPPPPTTHPLYRQLFACVRELSGTLIPPVPPVCSPLCLVRQRDLEISTGGGHRRATSSCSFPKRRHALPTHPMPCDHVRLGVRSRGSRRHWIRWALAAVARLRSL